MPALQAHGLHQLEQLDIPNVIQLAALGAVVFVEDGNSRLVHLQMIPIGKQRLWLSLRPPQPKSIAKLRAHIRTLVLRQLLKWPGVLDLYPNPPQLRQRLLAAYRLE